MHLIPCCRVATTPRLRQSTTITTKQDPTIQRSALGSRETTITLGNLVFADFAFPTPVVANSYPVFSKSKISYRLYKYSKSIRIASFLLRKMVRVCQPSSYLFCPSGRNSPREWPVPLLHQLCHTHEPPSHNEDFLPKRRSEVLRHLRFPSQFVGVAHSGQRAKP